MKQQKVYITLNTYEGWKVVLDGRIVDGTKPIFDSSDTSKKGLNACKNFCNKNNYKAIRECK